MIVAIGLPVLLVLTAFAVDLGRQRASRRTMQARADVIALDMVRIVNGRTEGQLKADAATEQALSASAGRNNIERNKITLEWGRWDNGGPFQQTLDSQFPNAVEIRAQEDTDYFFQPGDGHAERTAVATSDGEAEFSIGSYAAGLSTKDSQILGQLLGDAVNTNLVGYGGLVDNDINMLLLGQELVLLGAIGSPDEVFTHDIALNDLYLASASALRHDPDANPDDIAAATLFEQYAAQVPGGLVVPGGQLFHVEQGGEEAALTSDMNALDLLSASAFLSNGTNGIGAPQVSLAIPGIGQITQQCTSLDPPLPSPCNAVRIIEGPVRHRGRKGTGTSTRQVAVRVGFQGPLGGIAGAKVQFELDSAVGRGTIDDIRCKKPIELDLGIETGLIESDVKIDLTVLGVGVRITVSRSGGNTDETAHFLMNDDAGSVYEGGTGTLGLYGASVNVQLLGNVPPLVQTLVNTALSPVLTAITGPTGLLKAIDNSLMTPLTDLFGLNIAGADVIPIDAVCTNARLVR